MLVLANVKIKTVIECLLWVIALTAIAIGIFTICSKPATQPDQVNIQLYPVEVIQQELVDRGHDIVVDGVWGVNTDLANTVEVTK
jgi:hypothetical protein